MPSVLDNYCSKTVKETIDFALILLSMELNMTLFRISHKVLQTPKPDTLHYFARSSSETQINEVNSSRMYL